MTPIQISLPQSKTVLSERIGPLLTQNGAGSNAHLTARITQLFSGINIAYFSIQSTLLLASSVAQPMMVSFALITVAAAAVSYEIYQLANNVASFMEQSAFVRSSRIWGEANITQEIPLPYKNLADKLTEKTIGDLLGIKIEASLLNRFFQTPYTP